ncbi:M23 family metallopeptidase [Nocardia sp. BMG111209]|uniref:M23 family metallopeptidase n=1 Tax=Nocardia sp. BMG111209 TaxID=1160137 RepID=UPI0003607B98|nr:M23 family metallopeptidase [Nocardia sp. BMG111209]
MSPRPLQPVHRAQSARRYRGDGESFDNHPYFGGAESFGGAEPAPRPAGGAADWNAWSPADNPAGPDSGSWNAWDTYDPAATGHEDYEYAAVDDPFEVGRLDPDHRPGDGLGGGREGRRAGAHRTPAPPSSLKGRAAVVAVAAGAVVAAGQAEMAATGGHHPATADYQAGGQVHEIAAQAVSITDAGAADAQSPQVLNAAPAADVSQFSDILQHGQKFAADLAAIEDAKLRPIYSKFANGTFTSGFGTRWGAEHLGVDIAAPIGTPIYAVEDGTVIDAGPASGFGMWVRLKHDDGTITVYGHVDTAVVSVGQRVMAGDQIATVGNRGFSTGPHCHFEVWLNGNDKVDPLPWLASRGISLGVERD